MTFLPVEKKQLAECPLCLFFLKKEIKGGGGYIDIFGKIHIHPPPEKQKKIWCSLCKKRFPIGCSGITGGSVKIVCCGGCGSEIKDVLKYCEQR